MKQAILLLFLIFTTSVNILFGQPVNDGLCNAIPLVLNDECVGMPNLTTDGATAEENEPLVSCVSFGQDAQVYNSVWYSFVAPAVPIYLLAAPNSPTVTNSFQMSIYTLSGDCSDLSGLELVECNTPLQNLITAPAILTTLTEGVTYYVSVSGRTSSFIPIPFSDSGCITLMEVAPPVNDNVCNALDLTVDGPAQTFSNVGATAEAGEILISPPPGGDPLATINDGWAQLTNFIDNSVWFSFTTAPEGGDYSIDLLGTTDIAGGFNTQMAVYQAADCGTFNSFNLIKASDNSIPSGGGFVNVNSKMDLFCLPGNTTYHILVDGGATFLFQPVPNQGFFNIQVTHPEAVDLSVNSVVEAPLCEGGTDGTIILSATGGARSYSYQWSNGDSLATLRNQLGAGSYTVTITDTCGVELIETFDLAPSRFNDLNVEAIGDVAGCADSEVQLGATSSGGYNFDTNRLYFQESAPFPNLFFMAKNLQNPLAKDTIQMMQTTQLSEMEFVGDDLYGTDFQNYFYSVNVTTGEIERIDSLLVPSVSDLSYVPSSNILYCTTNDGTIYQVDPATAALTFVTESGINGIVQAAIDNSNHLFAAASNDTLYSFDLGSMVLQEINKFGVNPIAMRGMEVDPSTGKLYITASTTIAQGSGVTWQAVLEVDKMTGARTANFRDFTSTAATLAFAFGPRAVEPYSYTWTPAMDLSDATVAAPFYTVDSDQLFSVNVSDACGNESEDQLMVALLPDANTTIDTILIDGEMYNGVLYTADTVLIEMLVAANGCDSLVTVNISVVPNSLEEHWSKEAISLSPNPADDFLNIRTEGVFDQHTEIYLRDIFGRVLSSTNWGADQMQMDLTNLPSGHYFVVFKSQDKQSVRRFIKK